MKPFFFLTLLFLLILPLISFQQAKLNEPMLRAGVSAAPVNPPMGTFIAGDKQNRRFTTVHDSLFAKAVVLSKGNEQVAIVTIDCIGLLHPDVLRIRKRTAEICGFPEARIIVSSTHTHSGPDVVGLWGTDYQHSGVDSAYMQFLINTAALQVKAALENQQEVTAVASQTVFGKEWVQNICNEEIDRSVTILQLRNSAGKAVVTLTNFACHPTFLDAKFNAVSADYVNGYYKQMRSQTGAEALFLQGAIGGWVQPVDGEGTYEKAFRRGRELADAVLSALPKAAPLISTDIAFASKPVRLPVENAGWKQLADIGTIKLDIQDSLTTEIAWFSIGEAQFATHPGETAPFYGLETKKLMGSGPRFVLGLTNDALGYILKPTFFENKKLPHAEYLTSMSLGKPTGPSLMKELASIIPQHK